MQTLIYFAIDYCFLQLNTALPQERHDSVPSLPRLSVAVDAESSDDDNEQPEEENMNEDMETIPFVDSEDGFFQVEAI